VSSGFDSLEDGIRKPIKSNHNASILWKVMILAFPVV
jgi:hypothetical protein